MPARVGGRTRPRSSRRSRPSRPSTPCTRSTCPASAPPRSRRAAATTRPGSRGRCWATSMRWRSTARTSSATRSGGRVALEVALEYPDRVASLSLLAPAVAWRRKREFAPLVRLLRPELAAIPHAMNAGQVRETFWGLFAKPERLDPAAADLVAEEFCSHLPLPRRPNRLLRRASEHLPRRPGRRPRLLVKAVWPRAAGAVRLGRARPPGSGGFRPPRAEDALPDARQEILTDCGHVPQVELAERTNAMIAELIAANATVTAPVRRRGPLEGPRPRPPRQGRRPVHALARACTAPVRSPRWLILQPSASGRARMGVARTPRRTAPVFETGSPR